MRGPECSVMLISESTLGIMERFSSCHAIHASFSFSFNAGSLTFQVCRYVPLEIIGNSKNKNISGLHKQLNALMTVQFVIFNP